MLLPLLMTTLLATQDTSAVLAPPVLASPVLAPSTTAQIARRTETDKNVPVPKGTRVVLSGDGGEIIVKTWDRDIVHVQASHSSRMQVTAELKDQVLTIGETSGRVSTSVDYELTVPAWIALRLGTRYGDIEVDGVSGNVTVESVEGDLRLRGLSGQVIAKTIEGAIVVEGGRGRVQLTSVDGDVTVTKAAGEVTVETTDGDVTLSDVQASVLAVSTVDGRIVFTGTLQSAGQYEFTSHSGDVELTIPENSSATFGVRTYEDNNNVHTTFALKAGAPVRKGRRVTYTLGGGSAQVEIETFDGSFYLRKPGETVKK